MKKQNLIKKITSLLLCCTLIIPAFAGCGGGKKPPEEKAKYTITYNSVGGTEVSSAAYEEGTNIAEPTAPTKAFHVFDEWYEDAAYETRFIFGKMPANDFTVYAKWTSLSRNKLTFNSNGGTYVTEIVKDFGEAVTAPQNPTKENFDFAGWYSDAALTQSYTFSTMPKTDVKLYARWALKNTLAEVKVFAMSEEIKTIYATIGEALDLSNILPAQYVLVGWYSDASLSTAFNTSTLISASMNLYASYYSSDLAYGDGSIYGYNGKSKSLIIPATHNSKAVTSIEALAFANNQNIESIAIPSSVTEIGDYAFYQCNNLTSITIPATVTKIGRYAFSGTKIQSINVSSAESVGEGAFALCESLKSVTLDTDLTNFPNRLFYRCESLENIAIGPLFNTLGEEALSGCTGLKGITIDSANQNFSINDKNIYNKSQSVLYYYVAADKNETTFTVPASVQEMAKGAFYLNNSLKKVVIPSTVNTIQKGAMEKFMSLEELEIYDFECLPEGVTHLAYLFGAGTAQANDNGAYTPASLKTVTITNTSIDAVPEYACYGITGLEQVNGIENVSEIGKFAFAYANFSAFNFGKDIETISEGAFAHCNKLASYTVHLQNANYKAEGGYVYNLAGTKLVKVPSNIQEPVINASVTTIASYAFDYASCTKVEVPNTVTAIELAAFNNCSQFKELKVGIIGGGTSDTSYFAYIFGALPEQISETEYYIFAEDYIPDSFETLEITGNIEKVDNFAFNRCDIKNFKLPDSIKEFGNYSFSSNYKLQSFKFPANLEKIGEFAFTMGTLREVSIPGSVKSIGNGAFSQLPNLINITLNEGITAVPDGCFYPYYNSTSAQINSLVERINLPASLVTIGEEAFHGAGTWAGVPYGIYLTIADLANSKLTSIGVEAFSSACPVEVALPASLETLGRGAFADNLILRSITFGGASSKLNSIGRACFENSALTKITIPAEVTEIPYGCFYGTEAMTEITIAANSKLTKIGQSAFESSELVAINIPSTVTEIDESAFYRALSLKTVVLGDRTNGSKLEKIGIFAFVGCESLERFTLNKEIASKDVAPELKTTVAKNEYFNPFTKSEKVKIYVPENSKANYKAADVWDELSIESI